MNCWRLTVDWCENDKLLGASLMEAQILLWLLHLVIYQILTVNIQEIYYCDSGGGRKRITRAST